MRPVALAFFAAALSFFATIGLSAPTHAQGIPDSDFSIEVSPSPLATTVQPGKTSTMELKIRNASIKPERLKIESRSFVLGNNSEGITISDTTPKEMKEWIHYSAPEFTVEPGAWFTQTITTSLPASAGFTFPFAVVISRANDTPRESTPGRLLKGSVAVFTLINIDKPGATRKLELQSFTTSQPVYEYLPTTFTVKLKNVGNSIVQPYGNIYVQRDSTSKKSLGVLPVNGNQAYILPGKTRAISAQWQDGFPVYTKDDAGEAHLDWGTNRGAPFRIGKYTAEVVAVYNDGTRDVPITGEVTFWVMPWRILLGILVVGVITAVGVWSIIRKMARKLRHLRTPKQK